MAQAVSQRYLNVEAHIRSQASPYGICGGQSVTGTHSSPSASVFPCRYYSINAALFFLPPTLHKLTS
jgi:hypothetical protein